MLYVTTEKIIKENYHFQTMTDNPVLNRLYQYGGEQLEKYIKGLYVVAKAIPTSYVSAECNSESPEIVLSTTPGQPVRTVVENENTTWTEFPLAGIPEIQRDLDKYQGKWLGDAIGMAADEYMTAGSPKGKKLAESILRDIYHEVGHKLVHYANLQGRDRTVEEGVVMFLERFWFAYTELKDEKEAIKKAEEYLMKDLQSHAGMPIITDEERGYSANKFRYLNQAFGAHKAVVRENAKPEDLIFSDYMLPKGLK
ncbi:hypothetical protein E2P64_00095 [Candidatus Bathyarchaeota archaeon]|nr:hypothetical protein E2P64_00095 [Candidatus Bathyarchaeota archaeon]